MKNVIDTRSKRLAVAVVVVVVVLAVVGITIRNGVSGTGSGRPRPLESLASPPSSLGPLHPDPVVVTTAVNLNRFFLEELGFYDHFKNGSSSTLTYDEENQRADFFWEIAFTPSAQTEFGSLDAWRTFWRNNVDALYTGKQPIIEGIRTSSVSDAGVVTKTSHNLVFGKQENAYIDLSLEQTSDGSFMISGVKVTATTNSS